MRFDRYILDENGEPQPCADLMAWARWFESNQRVLRQTKMGPVLVSTVFLSIDHNFGRQGAPILWETMIFDFPKLNDYMERYRSREAALRGHELALERLKEFFPHNARIEEVTWPR
jgi:hypothetical protein